MRVYRREARLLLEMAWGTRAGPHLAWQINRATNLPLACIVAENNAPGS